MLRFCNEKSHVSPQWQRGFPRQSPLLLFTPFLLLSWKLLKRIITQQASLKNVYPCNRSKVPFLLFQFPRKVKQGKVEFALSRFLLFVAVGLHHSDY